MVLSPRGMTVVAAAGVADWPSKASAMALHGCGHLQGIIIGCSTQGMLYRAISSSCLDQESIKGRGGRQALTWNLRPCIIEITHLRAERGDQQLLVLSRANVRIRGGVQCRQSGCQRADQRGAATGPTLNLSGLHQQRACTHKLWEHLVLLNPRCPASPGAGRRIQPGDGWQQHGPILEGSWGRRVALVHTGISRRPLHAGRLNTLSDGPASELMSHVQLAGAVSQDPEPQSACTGRHLTQL
ncbi:hypothetical protein HaLaN_18243 [Haematococcus lacustris]|uniref:Uncharacterized protein n=1 Tax=Haematococcus lacustris TaxID=44745 RepID=A0A699ZYC4_HAELA|nr:hypothetical protein HaLaN_18243 [Haematococcus lacustris]